MPPPSWEQDGVEVMARFAVPPATSTKDVRCTIKPKDLELFVGGEPLFSDTLCAPVDVDESFWALEGSGAGRQVVITLAKAKADATWPFFSVALQQNSGAGTGSSPAVEQPSGGAATDVLSLGAMNDEEEEPEDAALQQQQEVQLEARFKQLREEHGLENDATLTAFFDLFNIGIQLYHLNMLSDYLTDVVPVCRKRDGSWKLKAIQAHGFVLWKQGELSEAVALFLEMEGLMGKNAALCENIAHTYNSLGEYEKAEDYFRQSLHFIESGCVSGGRSGGNKGGVLLGLGLVRDRLGRSAEALPILEQAYEFYRERAQGRQNSLQGKVAVSCSSVELKLGNVTQAERYLREAIVTYEITCGETSPLTGSAYFKLGQVLWQQRRRAEAREALKRAYELEVMKDAFTIVGVLEIHNAVMDTFLKETTAIEREGFASFFPCVDTGYKRVQQEPVQDGNAAVYYKAAAELQAWGGGYAAAISAFDLAISLFKVESAHDCGRFIQECEALRAFAQRNLDGSQASPMVLQTGAGSSYAEPEPVVERPQGSSYLSPDEPDPLD